MRTIFLLLLFLAGGLVLWSAPVPAADAEQLIADEKALQAAKVGTDGPSLLEFFRKRTLTDADRDRVLALIQKLGDDSFVVREQAQAELIKLENLAVALLRRAVAENSDIEIVRRSEQCLKQIDRSPTTTLAGPAARSCWRSKSRRAPPRCCWPIFLSPMTSRWSRMCGRPWPWSRSAAVSRRRR